MNDLHSLHKRTALDLHEIVKGCFAARLPGEPVPFPVADFEGIVFFGAVGIAGYPYQLIRLIDLKICQQIQLFCLLNILRGEVCHGLSLLSVCLLGIQMAHIIRLCFDNGLHFLHMGTFVMLPDPKYILQGMLGFEKCLTLLGC